MPLLVGTVGCALLATTFRGRDGRARLRRRRAADWLLDGSGLLIQGAGIPVLQATLLYALLDRLAPAWKGALAPSPWVAFGVNFVVIDYAYYWNHRLLHAPALWRWHAVHHTATAMDVLVTSRNTVWSHFLILYVWVNALAVFLLADPTAFGLAAAATAALDLWRHSEAAPGRLGRLLGRVLITPAEHAWHHSATRTGCNFGANLAWWDRLHGTYHRPGGPPADLGLRLAWTPLQRFLAPPRPLHS